MRPLVVRGEQAEEDRPVRVLFLMIHMSMGGSERLVFNLVKNLDRRVLEPSIAWMSPEPPLREFQELDVPLHHVPKSGRVDWSAMRRLAGIVRRHRIDVVNAHHFQPFVYAFYGTKIANRARLVYTEHSQADVRGASGKWRHIGCQLLRWADGAIGVSEPVSRTIESHFGVAPGTVHTIENGVDLEMFAATPERRYELRRQLGFSDTDVVLGHVANFRRNKNHLFLLRAFGEVTRSWPNVKLVLVGKGGQGDLENSQPDVARFIETHGLGGSVQVLGYRPDVHELLSALDVFCLVSYNEGLPLSVIEAMAAGLPVVASDIAALRQVVIPEVNGLLAAPDDDPALIAVLTRLVGDAALRRQMGAAGQQLARRKYSLTRCLQQTQNVLLAETPSRARAARVADDAPLTPRVGRTYED